MQTRRSFFGVLAGGVAAVLGSIGLKRSEGKPAERAGLFERLREAKAKCEFRPPLSAGEIGDFKVLMTEEQAMRWRQFLKSRGFDI